MRIQHNIMAMSAYRNYTNNVSAMKKNLEKLSSGYKINRAGDDAAGLAISEKMRAQITGLETAQKNAKDGISLVQTAEGALTEVHDMLNRMVELASQSANGTYDNTTDRAQMQKELNQLRSEIDRIADSSNFNGIQLLDGSMSSKGSVASTSAFSDLPAVGTVLGTDTVLHKDQAAPATKTIFSVELHNQGFDNEEGTGLKIKIGDDVFTYQAADTADGGQVNMGTKMTASDIAAAFRTGKFVDAEGNAMTNGKATIGGVEFTLSGTGSTLTFTQTNAADDAVKGDMTVEITGLKGGTAAVASAAAVNAVYEAKNLAVTYEGNLTSGSTYTLKLGGVTVASVTLDSSTAANVTAAKAAVDAATKNAPALAGYTGAVAAGTVAGTFTITYTKDTAGAVATAPTVTGLTLTEKTAGKDAVTAAAATPATQADDSFFQADYNVSTTNIQTKGEAANKDRLASTRVTVTKDMIAEGNSIRIGKDTYTFAKEAGTGKVDLTGLDENSDTYISDVLERLTKAAAGNTIYTVGHDDGNTFTVTEKETRNKAYYTGKTDADFDNKNDFDLRTKEGIDASLGFGKGAKAGNGLTLQIGDTADDFNQLKVDIEDCHVAALGIADISIADQASAAKAVDAIKEAINKVSDIRGTLGATQNRLDHTINNLSVMTENIQDAESTIRDVDVAEEMMAYTKNNILIQSAQAMLAQANQVPQGVLQLLQ